jgi:predicted nucleotidyltransferase
MSQQDLLTEVTRALQQQGIEFLLTGSHASSLQGEARSTHDIDLLVRLTLNDVDSLLRMFPPDRFYLSRSAIQDAIRSGADVQRVGNHNRREDRPLGID